MLKEAITQLGLSANWIRVNRVALTSAPKVLSGDVEGLSSNIFVLPSIEPTQILFIRNRLANCTPENHTNHSQASLGCTIIRVCFKVLSHPDLVTNRRR